MKTYEEILEWFRALPPGVMLEIEGVKYLKLKANHYSTEDSLASTVNGEIYHWSRWLSPENFDSRIVIWATTSKMLDQLFKDEK